MRVEDLFPLCQDRRCPEYGKHKHILPHQAQLIHAPEKFLLLKGGYGSAKTLAACVLCVLLMLSVPGNRVFVGRRTYDLLHDSTLRIFVEVVERAFPDGSAQFKENWKGWPHRIIFPNDAEVVFRETAKNLGRFLGPEYGVIYLDEAAEEPEDTFTKLMGRLRLPHAGDHLKFLLTTNPPHQNHWIAKRFGMIPGVIEVGDSKYRHITSSTRDNPHLPSDYLNDLLANLTPAEVARVVEGNFGFTPEGPPVYPPFRHEQHVGVPTTLPVALVRGWDFGFRHPACTWSQFWRCKRRTLHFQLLHETDGEQLEAEQFAQKVIAETRRIFPEVKPTMLLDTGDAQGAAVSDKGPGPIIRLSRPPFNLRFRYRKITNIDPGLDLVRKLMVMKCECGVPVFLVHRRCRNIIDMAAGGYHYPKNYTGVKGEKPVKDGFYDDYADATRYPVENFVRYEMASEQWANAVTENPAWWVGKPGWAWMERQPTAGEIAAEIERSKGRVN